MKKILMILFTSTALYSYAQPVNFGLKAGANFTSIKQEDRPNSDFKTGFHIGALAHIHMDDKLAVQPEIFYSTEGGQNINNSDIKVNLNYVNIPILLQYMFANGFRVMAGPQFGILTSAKQDINDVETDIKDGLKSLNIGVPVGLSYITSSGFGVDARWVFGLSDINDEANSVKTQTQGAQVGLFYLFNKKRNHTKK